ncbi:MAG: hypothetical protein ACXWC9_00660 [Pseudobdellovibrionaceae bacterium]
MFSILRVVGFVLCWQVLVEASVYQIPTKYRDPALRYPVQAISHFSNSQIASGDFVGAKRSEWKACHQEDSDAIFALSKDKLPPFVESSQIIKSLGEMEARSLQTGRADRQPWSGDYWPYDSGLLAARKFDSEFNQFWEWEERYDYVKSRPMSQFLDSTQPDLLKRLSPAEKYDLLMGQIDGDFTEAMWQEGKIFFDEFGKVEGWMGICHGWAPAAIVEPRPLKAIQVSSADQQWKLELLPGEIKGLLSYSWATNAYRAVTLGSRCNAELPPSDENGRLENPECFDLNPGTWHLAIVNRLGVKKKSFVMDATYDYQVWNQPVLEYSYQYFHPQSQKETGVLEEAQVLTQDWAEDPYRKYRSPEAKWLVGIQMKVAYVLESPVDSSRVDQESSDIIQWVVYKYDVELDVKGQIIGGEWHQTSHPDFIWTPLEKAQPISAFDIYLKDSWDGEAAIPATWQTVSAQASPRGIILNKVVQAVLKKSRFSQ